MSIMEERNLVVVALLSLITFGIYILYWFYKTAKELRQRGKEIPNFILILIPLVNIYYFYKYTKAAEDVADLSFEVQLLIVLFFGWLYPPIIQYKYNKTTSEGSGSQGAEGELEPLQEAEEMASMDMPDANQTENQAVEQMPSMDEEGADDDLGLDEIDDDVDFDIDDIDEEELDEDEDVESLEEEQEEEEKGEDQEEENPELEETVEEVEELLKEGKEQKQITLKLRGEGKSDELISQAYHAENRRNNYE